MQSYCSVPEAIAHFVLRRQNHIISRTKLLKNVNNLDQTLRNYDDDHLIRTFFYGSGNFNLISNKKIVRLTVCYLKDTERFNESLI